MTKNVMSFMIAIFVLSTSIGCVSSKKFNALQSEKDELASTLSDVQSKVKMLEDENMKMNEQNSELTATLGEVKTTLENTQSEVKMMKSEVTEKQAQIDAIRGEVQAAFAGINDAVSDSEAKIKKIEGALYVDTEDQLDFRTASATINPDDKPTLEKLAEMLKKHPNLQLVVEGHTDKRSISNAKYKDNWDLSAARSISIVRELIKMGVDGKQLIAAGRADTMPSASDDPDSKDALAKNRRVEIMVLPKVGTLYDISN